MEFLHRFMAQPYLVSVAAAALFLLAFPPFGLWPLIILGLTLFFLNAAYPGRTRKTVWWSGFLTGFLIELCISYQTLGNLQVLPGAEAFSRVVHMSPIVLAFMLGGLLFGAVAVLFSLMRTRFVLLHALAGASLYTLLEMPQHLVSYGYYWASIAHPFSVFPPALALSSVGGTFLVSFCIAWVACLLAEGILKPRSLFSAGTVSIATITLLCVLGATFANNPTPIGSITVASVQTGTNVPLLSQNGSQLHEETRVLIAEAGNGSASLAIFPWSLARGAFYQGPPYQGVIRGQSVTTSLSDHNAQLSGLVASGTTALVWPQVYDSLEDRFYETFQFVEGGVAVAEYRKQLMHPFSDYLPSWIRPFGAVTRNDSLSPGPSVNYTQVGNWRVGSLDCSELHRPALARRESRESDYLVSMGSDSMFDKRIAPRYSLAAAQYRAAENNIPVIRSALAGPSAVVGPGGGIIAALPQGATDILRADIPLYEQRPQTLYNRFGLLPVGLIIVTSLAAALLARRWW